MVSEVSANFIALCMLPLFWIAHIIPCGSPVFTKRGIQKRYFPNAALNQMQLAVLFRSHFLQFQDAAVGVFANQKSPS